MPFPRILKSWPLLLPAACAAACLFAWASFAWADGGSWKNKPLDQWDQDDAKQLLADSPWVGSVHPEIVRDLSPDERRASGNMEADIGKGVGLAGTGIFGAARAREAIARAHAKPDPGNFLVLWESARPVRAAEHKLGEPDPPVAESDYYKIVVYNIPTPKRWNIEKELRGIAALKREKKKDLKPSRVQIVFREEGKADVIYLFRRSVEITKKDSYVGFSAQIGRLVLWQVFYPPQMLIQGRVEL